MPQQRGEIIAGAVDGSAVELEAVGVDVDPVGVLIVGQHTVFEDQGVGAGAAGVAHALRARRVVGVTDGEFQRGRTRIVVDRHGLGECDASLDQFPVAVHVADDRTGNDLETVLDNPGMAARALDANLQRLGPGFRGPVVAGEYSPVVDGPALGGSLVFCVAADPADVQVVIVRAAGGARDHEHVRR